MKRPVKDSYAVGEMLTDFMTSDEVKENAIMNESNSHCLDMTQLLTYREHTLLEIESPLYQGLSANSLFGFKTLSLCVLNGD